MAASPLTDEIKRVARRLGAVKVGIAGKANLAGPPEADMTYVMPEAETAVMYCVVLDKGLVRKYLSKEDVWLYRNHFFENLQRLGDIGRSGLLITPEFGEAAVVITVERVYALGGAQVGQRIL